MHPYEDGCDTEYVAMLMMTATRGYLPLVMIVTVVAVFAIETDAWVMIHVYTHPHGNLPHHNHGKAIAILAIDIGTAIMGSLLQPFLQLVARYSPWEQWQCDGIMTIVNVMLILTKNE